MRFATILTDGKERAAVSLPDRGFVPVRSLFQELPDDLMELLDAGLTPELLAELAEAAANCADEDVLPRDSVQVGPPYRRPRKLLGIGLNYRAHADDLAAPFPDEPASFLKGDHTIIGPDDEIVLPAQSQRVTAEAELAVVIGRECWQVEESEALSYVAGVCLVLDQTAEDILARNPRFLTRSKNFPTFYSFGPELITTDEVLDRFGKLDDIVVGTYRNGELHRDNVVANMEFSPEFLVSFHSKVMPLYPGDMISTGTPGAVVIEDGDTATCRIDGLGSLSNPVRRARG